MRIILFTGKGGTGKTTIAAATALKASKQGYKTLVISTDPAHSLSDALNIELEPEPVKVCDNMWGQELDVYYSMKKYWGNMRQLMLTIFKWQGVKNVMAEEMAALPGMEEASAFLWIEKYFNEANYDLLVIDSAPTGETLTLLSLPQVTKWWVTRAIPLQKFAIMAAGKAIRKTTGVPIDKGYAELQVMFEKLEHIQQIFSDVNCTSIRLVCNPEKMVIKEAKRAYTYLQLFGYNVDAVAVNRILPSDAGSVFSDYMDSQKKYVAEIEDSFSPLPILKVEHLGSEVFGISLLNKIADMLYDDDDPTIIYHEESPFKIEETESGHDLQIKLPFLNKGDLSLHKFGDELVLEIGNQRKNIFLPRFANFLLLNKWSYEDPWLIVSLVREKD